MRTSLTSIECPGCGLVMRRRKAVSSGSSSASPECWAIYTDVLATESGNAVLFEQVHQLTIDAYALQHAAGSGDQAIGMHLCGLVLVLERGLPPPEVPLLVRRLALSMPPWPHFTPPARIDAPTVRHVALAAEPTEHARRARAWATAVWRAWAPHHAVITALVQRQLGRA